jgi:hypothetical protein
MSGYIGREKDREFLVAEMPAENNRNKILFGNFRKN